MPALRENKSIPLGQLTEPDIQESVQISARLSGRFAKMWDYITSEIEHLGPTQVIKDAIRLLAFATQAHRDGFQLTARIRDERGREVKIADVVKFLNLTIAENHEHEEPSTPQDSEEEILTNHG